MFSNLVKANYEIKDVSLLSLRNRIVEENNLTPLEILKGFHAKSKIDLKYNSALTEQNLKDIKTIEDEYERYISTEIKNNIQSIYDDKFNSLFEDCKKECPRITLDDILKYKNKESGLHVEIQNAAWRFLRSVSDLDRTLKTNITKDAKNYITSYIEKTFGDTYKIGVASVLDKFKGLPSSLDTNAPIDIDFSQVFECVKDRTGDFADWITLECNSNIGSDTYKIVFYKYDMIDIFVHLPESKAKEVFDTAINSVIYQNNSIGELEYLQNLESQPITININTKTNKYELIDGYKRLLYITDESLLKYSAPVKFFTDLNDSQFLTLLYAANVWKDEEYFHDRGFLFALKTRFNFTIPLSAYGNIHSNELSTLRLYDFGGNLVRVSSTKIMNTLLNHKYLVSDISLMYNFLPQVAEKQTYDKNMSDEIMFAIIELVGELRRTKDNETLNELSEELITSIFEDDLIKKSCSKKHLSTRTYVINYFRDKGLYKRIIEILKNNLFIKQD